MDVSSRVRRLWDGARRLPPGGVITVTTGFLLHLSLGCMYSFGNLTTYLTSYLHVRLGLSVDYSDTQWIYTIFGLVKGPGVLLGGMACRRFGPRLTLLVGSLFLSVGMALCCLAVQTSFATTIVAFSVLGGFGNGLAYTTPMLVGYMWFPRHRGAVSGVVVGGFGLGSIIFTSVQTSYLNPENISPEDDGYFHDAALLDRVPSLFLVQAAICAGLQLCGILGVRPPPKPKGQETRSGNIGTEEETSATGEAGESDTSEYQSVSRAKDDESVDEDPKAWRKYVLTTQTLQLTLVLVMNANGMMPVNTFWKAFGQTFIRDDHFLAMVGSGSSVFNMSGRLVWGLMCDVTGYKPTMVAIAGLLAAFLFTFPLTSVAGQGMFLVWVWALYFCMSGTYSVVVTGTADTFGVQHAGHIYGVSFLATSLCSPPMTYAIQAVMDRWDYSAVFLLGGSCVCIGLVATLTFRSRRRAGDKPLEDDV